MNIVLYDDKASDIYSYNASTGLGGNGRYRLFGLLIAVSVGHYTNDTACAEKYEEYVLSFGKDKMRIDIFLVLPSVLLGILHYGKSALRLGDRIYLYYICRFFLRDIFPA